MRMYENRNIHTKTGFDQLDLDATCMAPKLIEWHVIMIIRARRKLLASGRTDQYHKKLLKIMAGPTEYLNHDL